MQELQNPRPEWGNSGADLLRSLQAIVRAAAVLAMPAMPGSVAGKAVARKFGKVLQRPVAGAVRSVTGQRGETMITSFADYAARLQLQGYEEVVLSDWLPGEVVEIHHHPFDAKALVVKGEMWLTQRGETRHLTAGDSFELDAEEPHAERHGHAVATYWVGRRARRVSSDHLSPER
jgi:quercetin dioxygenase-like cupin family protein